ncbi:MAG: hypothetical protein ACI9FD_005015, partial [Gammaproteobacteria bacterium]
TDNQQVFIHQLLKEPACRYYQNIYLFLSDRRLQAAGAIYLICSL